MQFEKLTAEERLIAEQAILSSRSLNKACDDARWNCPCCGGKARADSGTQFHRCDQIDCEQGTFSGHARVCRTTVCSTPGEADIPRSLMTRDEPA